MAAAVMTAAVAEHAAAAERAAAASCALVCAPTPPGPPGPPCTVGWAQPATEEGAPGATPADEDGVEALRRKVRKLVKRVAALEAARAGESD